MLVWGRWRDVRLKKVESVKEGRKERRRRNEGRETVMHIVR